MGQWIEPPASAGGLFFFRDRVRREVRRVNRHGGSARMLLWAAHSGRPFVSTQTARKRLMKLRGPWLVRLVGLLGGLLIRMWMNTLRLRVSFPDSRKHPA